MRRIAELPIILLFFVMLIVASYAQMTSYKSIRSSGVIKRLDWLRVEGQWIVDESGNRIQLRGSGCDYTAYEKYSLLESYFQLLSSKGCNVVRLAFTLPGHRYGTTTVDTPEKMDRTLALCAKYGLYAILDCHHYGEFADPNYQGSTADNNWYQCVNVNCPEAIYSDGGYIYFVRWGDPSRGIPAHTPLPWASCPVCGSSWKQPLTYTNHWIEWWVNIATRYKDNPVVAGYELCNEPYSMYFPEAAIPCMEAIRQVDNKHIIFLADGCKWWYEWAEGAIYPRRWWVASGDGGYGTVVPNDPNIVFDIHHWAGALVRVGLSNMDASDYYCEANEPVFYARFLREHLQRPVWMGEFGAYNLTPPNPDLDHEKDIIRLCEEAGIMWTNWMMEQNKPWDYLIPTPFTSSILPADVPKPFNPKPFNMLNYTLAWNKREVGYNRWGSSFYQFSQIGDWITLKGPCKFKIVKWNNITDFYNRLVKSQEVITITAPEATITYNWPEFTRIFAYEGS